MQNERGSSGKQIAEKPDQVKRIDDNWYQVKSQSLSYDSWYDVVSTESGFVCNCPDNQWRKVKCKHIFATEISIQLRKLVSNQVTIKEVIMQSCLVCKSKNIKKDGLRHNKNYDIQKYECKECGKKFSVNIGFERMHASPQMITSAIQLYRRIAEKRRKVPKSSRCKGRPYNHLQMDWKICQTHGIIS